MTRVLPTVEAGREANNTCDKEPEIEDCGLHDVAPFRTYTVSYRELPDRLVRNRNLSKHRPES